MPSARLSKDVQCSFKQSLKKSTQHQRTSTAEFLPAKFEVFFFAAQKDPSAGEEDPGSAEIEPA